MMRAFIVALVVLFPLSSVAGERETDASVMMEVSITTVSVKSGTADTVYSYSELIKILENSASDETVKHIARLCIETEECLQKAMEKDL